MSSTLPALTAVAPSTDPRTALSAVGRTPALDRPRRYFASDTTRTVQSALGLIWLLDGLLQFQSYMYGRGFVQMLIGMESGEPSWVAHSVNWAATALQAHQTLFNTLCGLAQVVIGVGLLYRRTVKPAIAVSFVWALVVWWLAEAFGNLLMNTASPLTGAPGAVILYAIIGAIVWPNGRPGGLLGVLGARAAWAALWVLMGAIWLLAANSSANATHDAIMAAPSGASWLSSLQTSVADATKGHGTVIAIIIAIVSVAIGMAGAINWQPKTFLWIAIGLNAAYWVIPQGLGGILIGNATDPNAGPLFILFAVALYALVPNPSVLSVGVGKSRAHTAAAPPWRSSIDARDRGPAPSANARDPKARLALTVLGAAALAALVPEIISLTARASSQSAQSSVQALPQRTTRPAHVGPGPVATVLQVAPYRIGLRLTPNRATASGTISLQLLRGNRPERGARVRATFSMPGMGGGTGLLQSAGPGRYGAVGPVLGMIGTWQLRFEVTPVHGKAFGFGVVDQIGA